MIFRETLELRKNEYVYGGVYLELFDLQVERARILGYLYPRGIALFMYLEKCISI